MADNHAEYTQLRTHECTGNDIDLLSGNEHGMQA